MSKSHRRHLPPGVAARRGPKNRNEDGERHPPLKTNKQLRRTGRQELRREYR